MSDINATCHARAESAELHRMDNDPANLAGQIRAARAYARKSRAQIARATGYSAVQVGRWERGAWGDTPPRGPQLAAIARLCEIPPAWVEAGFLAEPDPARRFADAARREAQRRGERHASGSEAPRGAGADGEGL